MSDVGVVVLTLGERSTGRALASLRAQTLPIEQVEVVAGVRPFHRALNEGAGAVSTPFFLQIDADMVLDDDCAACLRAAMTPDAAMTVGCLRDPLMGRITGVKLFRRECFDAVRLRDVLAPEVDFRRRLAGLGWDSRYLLGLGRPRGGELGDHRPAYTVDYVYGTYYLLGARHAARRDAEGLAWRLGALRRSRHRMAPVARLALQRGTSARETRDVPKPHPPAADRELLRALADRARLPLGA